MPFSAAQRYFVQECDATGDAQRDHRWAHK